MAQTETMWTDIGPDESSGSGRDIIMYYLDSHDAENGPFLRPIFYPFYDKN